MEIFPAIDISGGKVVRLSKGDYDKMTVYGDDPAAMARRFKEAGARNLHVVDLDGAKDGTTANFDAIEAIAREGGLTIEVGGGIRDAQRIRRYLDCGVSRTILGTVAVKNYAFVEDAVARFGDAIAVGVDAKDGVVAVSGWLETTELSSLDFCRRLEKTGVSTVIYTDISKDGMLSGTNLPVYEALAGLEKLKVIASGGITFEHEITALKQMGIYGAIVGKAIYSGALELSRVLALAR